MSDQRRLLLAEKMDTIAVDLVVTGHVQGVFFRASMREQADRLGVTGWVRNEPDGTVHAHLEGAPEAVDELVSWCAEGVSSIANLSYRH